MVRSAVLSSALLALTLTACSEPTGPALDAAIAVQDINATAGKTCVELFAGQTTDAGDVCLAVSGNNLAVTYTTTGGWQLTGASLWAGLTLAAMPQTNTGNPKIGLFPYQSGTLAAGATTYQFLLPLSAFGLDASMTSCLATKVLLAAHANVRLPNGDGTFRTETGWGDGQRLVTRGSWAMYFAATLTCVADTPPQKTRTETAFAYGGASATCFIGMTQLTTNRWGWTNGPLAAGTYTFDLYAGAGQCDRSKGTKVGTLTVVYSGSTATVTYTMLAGFTLDETHLYVGGELLPRKNGEYTVAPGQYPAIHDLSGASSDSYTVSGLSGSVYVVAHAVVTGPFAP